MFSYDMAEIENGLEENIMNDTSIKLSIVVAIYCNAWYFRVLLYFLILTLPEIFTKIAGIMQIVI